MSRKRQRLSTFDGLNPLNKNIGQPSQLSKFAQVQFDTNLQSPQLPQLPIVSTADEWKKNHDSDVETVETVSPAEPVSLEYRIIGLTWYTPQIVNSCHMDSFLSSFVRQVRQTHGKILKKIICRDAVGNVLIEIGIHVLKAKNLLDSTFVKKLWLDAVMNVPVKLPFDAAGLEQFSIFQHLKYQSGFHLQTKCRCGPFQYIFDCLLRSVSLRDLQAILTNQTGSNSSLPFCLTCQTNRSFVSFSPISTNWLVTVLYDGNDVPDFAEIIPFFEVNRQLYKLAYLGFHISAQQTTYSVGHLVSLQQIRGSWYLYDGLKSPSFTLWDNIIRYDRPGAVLKSIVYFLV